MNVGLLAAASCFYTHSWSKQTIRPREMTRPLKKADVMFVLGSVQNYVCGISQTLHVLVTVHTESKCQPLPASLGLSGRSSRPPKRPATSFCSHSYIFLLNELKEEQ